MAFARWCLFLVAMAGCGGRALTVLVADAGPPPTPDGMAVETPPAPGSVLSASPAGVADPAGGATNLGPLVATSDGGVIVAGSFSGTVSFAADKTLTASGARDAFVARYRRDQRLVWVRPLGAGADEVVISSAAALPGDEVVVAGWFSGTLTLAAAAAGAPPRTLTSAGRLDGFVARLASDGSVRWAVRAGAADDDIVRGVAATAGAGAAPDAAAIAITGTAGAAAVFGPGEKGQSIVPAGDGPIFAARLGAGDGALAWAAFAGSGVPAQGYGVAVDDAQAGVAVTGYLNGPALFGAGTPLATRVDPAGGRAFVARWDSSGRFSWVSLLGGAAGEGDAVAATATGDLVVIGTFEGRAGFATAGLPLELTADTPGVPGCFLARLGRDDGVAVWARRLTGRGLRPWRVRAAGGGDLLVAASFGGGTVVDPDGPGPVTVVSAGGDDAVFLRLDGAGALRWASPAGGLGDDEASDVVAASDGFVWAAGRYFGPVTFGTGAAAVPLGSGTDGAGFILRLWP